MSVVICLTCYGEDSVLVFVGRSITPPVVNHTLIGFPILLFVFVIIILLSVIMIYRHRHRTDVFD